VAIQRVEAGKPVSITTRRALARGLDVIAALLADQCRRGYAAFDAFQALVRDHAKSILQHQLRETNEK
jgi:hypothetical protein